eukprot:TRINITY_DN901_c0_g2_i2.p2 TRINITY_DN901_c0_g2~~TRINITY_DN901_c0_g2_i2.p2  ORF type:complete len:112 (+),score=10.79 TRINITY_DN901_c0_g2_i2:774-1109(+)
MKEEERKKEFSGTVAPKKKQQNMLLLYFFSSFFFFFQGCEFVISLRGSHLAIPRLVVGQQNVNLKEKEKNSMKQLTSTPEEKKKKNTPLYQDREEIKEEILQSMNPRGIFE